MQLKFENYYYGSMLFLNETTLSSITRGCIYIQTRSAVLTFSHLVVFIVTRLTPDNVIHFQIIQSFSENLEKKSSRSAHNSSKTILL